MKRILILMAFFAILLSGVTAVQIVRADNDAPVTIHAQGSGYLTDFMTAANKRGDLRTSITQKGWDAAFTQWLKSERPGAYREEAKRALASTERKDNGVKPASSYCCARDGKCCKSNCAQCCAKGDCKMNCCEMKVCKDLRTACCK